MNEHIHIRLAQDSDISAVSFIAQTAYAPYIERIGLKPAPMTDDFPAKKSAAKADKSYLLN